ncbi:MAG: hypothetical protein Q9M94_01120 [Candidatus Gracilibacteria bacterium]|nr:hypothetical protein [Candidatus Gracilibacteria bacterium]MDQ7023003.1 hypothetical protein [Candidatus Gracilibacteria bacterium]
MKNIIKRNLWGEIIISLILIGFTFGWGLILVLGYYIYKKDFRFIGGLFYTFGLFFASLFACLPFVDTSNSGFIPFILIGFLLFWIFTFNKMFSGNGKKENINSRKRKK